MPNSNPRLAYAISTLVAIWLLGAGCALAAGVAYESVGIGEDDPVATMSDTYNLHMIFALQGSGEYLAEIKVRIDDAKGENVLETTSPGPIFYAKLPAGNYRVTADSQGKSVRKSVAVKDRGLRHLYFYWPAE